MRAVRGGEMRVLPLLRMMAVSEHWRDGVAIYAKTDDRDGLNQAVVDVSLEQISSTLDQEYTPLHLSREGAAELRDSLWRAGIRPTDHRAQTAGRAHLQDMRSRVQRLLGGSFK